MTFSEAEYRIRVAGQPGTTVMVELSFSRTPGSPYTIIVQDTAPSLTFPSDPDAGWSVDTIPTGSGVSTCLAGARLYLP